jgi:hypothetical protein
MVALSSSSCVWRWMVSSVGAYTPPDPCTPRPSTAWARRARAMPKFPPENLRNPARAPRGAPCASSLPLNSTVGGPWGAKRGARWARVWHTCGTPIWAWHVATRVCRACEARGWFILGFPIVSILYGISLLPLENQYILAIPG